MEKYKLIPEQLLYEGTIREENLFRPGQPEEDVILWTHDPAYWEKLKSQTLTPKEIRRTGFPLSPRLVARETQIAEGSIQAALFALEFGVAMNIAGGTHHAFTDRGEGFCLLNDFAIAANFLLRHELAKKILVVDLDVHQGNGTAEIFRDRPEVFTFSMHCEANYPLQKEQSDLDIPLKPYTTDKAYLSILRESLPRLLDEVQPDFIFYLSGVDILETDKLGKLACTREGCRDRDAFVLKNCKENHIPVAVSMGGGYSWHIRDIVEAHCNTYRLAQEIWF
jgi:acetoin utilization deacetylase AcuC-like enzyme